MLGEAFGAIAAAEHERTQSALDGCLDGMRRSLA